MRYDRESCDAHATLERLIAQYSGSILKMCYVYLKDTALAEDALQETFIKAYRSLAAYQGNTAQAEKAWLMRIAINTCKDVLRGSWFRHVDRRAEAMDWQAPAQQPGDEDGMLVEAITRLPRKEKEVILLYYYQDLKVEEIASALGIAGPTVYARLKRARARLSTMMEGGCEA